MVKKRSTPKQVTKDDEPTPNRNTTSKFAPTVLFLVFSYLHYYHIYTLFENDRFFSHLSEMEREMTFRTDAGFYYSFYKTIVRADSFYEGVRALVNDTGTEYPTSINALQRFNVYPEVCIGGLYRVITSAADWAGVPVKSCYRINRGYGMEPVRSCDGIGDEAIFYITSVFVVGGLTTGFLYLLGRHLSGNFLGGIVAVSCYFFNHSECTRIMWTPPLRENFSFPFLILQLLLLSTHMKNEKSTISFGLIVSTVAFILPWQFSQFVLLTQSISLYGAFILGFINEKVVKSIINSVFMGFCIGIILQFLNTMLISSLYVSSFIAFHVVIAIRSRYSSINRLFKLFLDVTVFISVLIMFKVASAKALNLTDDAHIFNILKAKFSDFRDFHTLLYVCAREFDFLPLNTVLKLVLTLLVPTAGLVTLLALYRYGKAWAQDQIPAERAEQNDSSYVVFHMFQLKCFVVMAAMLMRLKLFMTPYLCLVSSLVMHPAIVRQTAQRRYIITFVLLGCMTIQGSQNLLKQRGMIGEYNNPQQEELFDWVKDKTPSSAVFCGSMPVMANLRLSTGRNIVNHPHYEDSGLRQRTKLVYQLYSRKEGSKIYKDLKDLQVEYAVLDKYWCMENRPKDGCAIPEIWDIEDPQNKGKPTFCSQLAKYNKLFELVFSNSHYRVVRLS